jgi:hypothetical protein
VAYRGIENQVIYSLMNLFRVAKVNHLYVFHMWHKWKLPDTQIVFQRIILVKNSNQITNEMLI